MESASHHGVRPDIALFTSVLSAFERRDVWSEALVLLDDLLRARLRPDSACCNAALSACASSAQWACAFALFDRMRCNQAAGVASVDSISVNILLGACVES